MQDLDENTVTDAALAQMADTQDPRLKQIMDAAVRHLHAFAREVELTPAEWLTGIQFLTAVGQACTPIRQEFILLSDVLGLSAVVNALHDKKARELGTQSSLLGPFYREGAPALPLGASIIQNPSVPEIVLYGRVTDNAGNPVPGASVQVWQTSEHGLYAATSAATTRAAIISAPSVPWATRSRWTGRWASWCTGRSGTASAPRTSIC
jgi:hydroxyquinol 1,2-dioxygenase